MWLKRLACLLRGHMWINAERFADERLHGARHYFTDRTRCGRCGCRPTIGARGRVATLTPCPNPPADVRAAMDALGRKPDADADFDRQNGGAV